MTAAKLNLGCGGQIAVGWLNLDRSFDALRSEGGIFFPAGDYLIHDLREPLPFPDDHFRCAVAHHVLDMLDHDDLALTVAELHRVLEPGGVLRVSSVDYRFAIQALVQRDEEWFVKLGVRQDTALEAFEWYLDWGGARRTVFYAPEHLAQEYLAPAGFECERVAFHETISAMPSICDLDSREGESWFLEARKP